VAFHYSLAISWSIRAISKWPFLRAHASGVAQRAAKLNGVE